MSQFQSDPAFVVQFRRRWGADPATIKFLSELSETEHDRLSIAYGERIVLERAFDLQDVCIEGQRDI